MKNKRLFRRVLTTTDGHGKPSCVTDAQGKTHCYAYDLHGNTVAEFGTGTQPLVLAYDYAPFGAVTSTGTVANPLQWSSEHYDSELGLVYYNYRHYSPYDGRFLSRDPIAEQGVRNLYAFVAILDKYDYLGLLIKGCKAKLAGALETQKYKEAAQQMEEAIVKMSKKGKQCRFPKIECLCCGERYAGKYSRTKNRIAVCAENHNQYNAVGLADEVLVHEMVHAIQECEDFGNSYSPDTCKISMCREIQAHIPLCKGGKDLRECLKSLVLDNVITHSCKEKTSKQLESIFNDLYKKCAKDPFTNLKIK